MKSALAAIIVFSLAPIAMSNAAPAPAAAKPDPVNTSVGFSLDNTTPSESLTFVAELLHAPITVDSSVPSLRMSANASNLEARYAIAWFAHLANSTVKTENNTLTVRPASAQPKGDAAFDCWSETNGAWRVALEEALSRPISMSLADVPASTIIQMASRIEGVSLIFMDNVTIGATMVTVNINGGPVAGILDALSESGLTCTLQGGFIFIDKAQSAMHPGKASANAANAVHVAPHK